MAGLRVAVPPLRFRVRGLGPTVTLTRGGCPDVEIAPAAVPVTVDRLVLRCRECDLRLDEPPGPTTVVPGAAATLAARESNLESTFVLQGVPRGQTGHGQ